MVSRLTEAKMLGTNTDNTGIAASTMAYRPAGMRPVMDLASGGQHGWSPNLTQWVNNQAYVSRPLHCILLEAPKMFEYFPDTAMWIASLKALFELHAYAIEGFNAELKVDTEGHDVGGGGEKQHEVMNVTRETSTPKFTFIEKYGRPIQTMLDFWIRYGLMDPETKFALLGTLGSEKVTAMDASWYTATCIFIVPDPTHRTVDKAWLTTNMFPTSTGQITGKRDLKSGQELLTLDIEFPGMSQVGLGVNALAQSLLDGINFSKADPFMKAAFAKGVTADILTTGSGVLDPTKNTDGYVAGVVSTGLSAGTRTILTGTDAAAVATGYPTHSATATP